MARGDKWFKHYNTASEGHSIGALIVEHELEAGFFYWLILELVSRWEKPESRGRITTSMRVLSARVCCLLPKTSRLLSKLIEKSLVRVSGDLSETFEIEIPNWAELQERRGGFHPQSSTKTPIEVRSKEVRSKNKKKNIAQTPFAQQVERLYLDLYPNKRGKAAGLKKLAKEISAPEDLAALELAIKNYCTDLAANPWRHPLHFSTFAGQWRDWLTAPPEVPTAEDLERRRERELDAQIAREIEEQKKRDLEEIMRD